MRILFVSQYFPPEIGAPAARVHELAREWVRLGHEVTVLTAFAHHPTGIKAPRDHGVLTRREARDGIDVVRSYVYASANKGTLKRMASYASFMASALVVGAGRLRRPDVVVGTSPQLLCAAAGFGLAHYFRVPFVFEVRDLWPESILAVNAMRENALVRGLKWLARSLYRRCERIVTVGEGYREEIHRRYDIPLAKMDVVTNGIDTKLFVPGARDNWVRQQYGWEDRFVVLYLGTHGMAHALHVVLETAAAARDRDDILFAFVGEGAEKDQLQRQAAARRLGNVQFINPQPKERVPQFYAACDVGLVTLRNTSLFQSVLPSKIFEYLGMERPILLSVGGEARRVVEESGGGIYVNPEDPAALLVAVLQAARERDRFAEMGRRGRQYILEKYDRRALAQRYLGILEESARRGNWNGLPRRQASPPGHHHYPDRSESKPSDE